MSEEIKKGDWVYWRGLTKHDERVFQAVGVDGRVIHASGRGYAMVCCCRLSPLKSTDDVDVGDRVYPIEHFQFASEEIHTVEKIQDGLITLEDSPMFFSVQDFVRIPRGYDNSAPYGGWHREEEEAR